MDIAINAISRIISSYHNQSRIADLMRESNVKVAQSQEDRVTISSKARDLALQKGMVNETPTPPPPAPDVAQAVSVDDSMET